MPVPAVRSCVPPILVCERSRISATRNHW
jgi:hypothetical protein